MGRDGALPRSFFGRLNAKRATPVLNIILTGVTGLGAIFLDVATSTSFINFGAFTAFTLVNIACISHFIRHRGEGLSPLWFIVVPAVGALVGFYLLTQLDGRALTLGVVWLILGIAYLAFLTRGSGKNRRRSLKHTPDARAGLNRSRTWRGPPPSPGADKPR
ncbi:hypothetical protein [Micrococcus luteus]|uniref:hypothetical protein n=1 Tax=Micrococcus luteus TaxID=1270 RepID=UPI00214DABA8|nr:hypothetical protein [Micrococcus luteus]